MPAALKRKARAAEPASPPVPDARLGLHDAIERKRECDDAVTRQHEAIYRAQALVTKAEEEIEKLRAKIETADAADEKRAASLIKVERPVISAWSGESARRAVEHAERNLELTIKGRAKLKSELAALELEAKIAENDVLTERIKLVAPIAAATLAKLQSMRREMAEGVALLNVLVRDDAPDFTSNDLITAKNCEAARRAAFGAVKDEANNFAVRTNSLADFEAQKAITAEWTTKLARLLADANAEL